MKLWVAVNFAQSGSNDPGSLLGVFDNKELALRILKDEWDGDIDNITVIDHGEAVDFEYGKKRRADLVAQVFAVDLNKKINVDI